MTFPSSVPDLFFPSLSPSYCSYSLFHPLFPFRILQYPLLIAFLVIRFSSATNRLITAKDHASVQFNIGIINEDGVYTGQNETIALCGYIRAKVSLPLHSHAQDKSFLVDCRVKPTTT